MSYNMPLGATSDQYEEWAGSQPPISEKTFICTNCEEKPCTRRVRGYELCDDCVIPAIIQAMRETESGLALGMYLEDLMTMGYVAEVMA